MLKLIIKFFKNELDLKQIKSRLQEIALVFTEKTVEKIISFFNIKGNLIECKKQLENVIANHEALGTILTTSEDMINHTKEFFDHFGDALGDKSKRGTYFCPDFELDLSLFDFQFVFKKDLYYEIKYRDPKYNTIETISYGGSYKVQTAKGKGTNSSDLSSTKTTLVEEGSKTLYDKKESAGFTIFLDKICEISYGTTIRSFQNDKHEKSSKSASNVYNNYTALICSVGFNPARVC